MRTAVVLLAGLLAGCGFQLRGAQVLPADLGALYLVAPAELRREVEIFLQGSQTRLTDDRASAAVVLRLSNPRHGRRVLSVDPATGKEREFELSYTVDVAATGRDGRALMTPQPVGLVRDLVFDRDALVGTSREEGVLIEEMRRDVVQQVLYRLRAATAG